MIAAVNGNKAYFPGTGTGNVVVVFDATDDSFTVIGSGHSRTNGGTVIALGNYVLFAGGYSNTDDSVTNKIDIYDSSDDSWTPADSVIGYFDCNSELLMYRTPRGLMGAAVSGNLVYLVGGVDGDNNIFDDVYIWDITTKTWASDNLPAPRGGMGSASVGTTILFAKGYTSGLSISDTIDIYTPGTGQTR